MIPDDFLYNNKRRIIYGIIALFAIVIVLAIWTFIDRVGKTPLTISVVPSDAKILVDNRSVSNGTHWLPNRTYTIVVKKDGFAAQQVTVTVTDKKTQNVAAFSLEPQSSTAKEWATTHQNEYKKNEVYGAVAARTNGQYFTSQNPITKYLPFTDPYFTIGYRAVDDNTIILTISTPSPRYRFYAVEKIRELGYEPTDFAIQFTDFRNPLENTQ